MKQHQHQVYKPFRTSVMWHLGGLMVKGLGAILKAFWECMK